ncbi:putative skeletal organic matrix protein 5 isoform X2 [Oculina patagonica]
MRLFFAVSVLTINLLVLIAICGAKTSSLVKVNQTPSGPAKNFADNMMVCNLIQDSHVSEAIKTLEMKLEKLTELVNKSLTSKPKPPAPVSSCKEQYDKDKSSKSEVFTLMFGSQKIPVYCHMGNFGCGDGGWTPVMKIDGNKKTFHYDSQLWSDKNTSNLAGGKTGFDLQETKLPSYWNTSFSKICLGMKIGQQINFIVINKQANSLYSLIADGQYRSTSLGRNTWKTLIGSQASLQTNCNKEGFNAADDDGTGKARIGFLGNDQNSCRTCDSRIGFALRAGSHTTCGNFARHGADNGDKSIKAMGYILVQ